MIEFSYIEFVSIVFGVLVLCTLSVNSFTKRRLRSTFEEALLREAETASGAMRLLQERLEIKTRDLAKREAEVKLLETEIRALAESEAKA